MTKNNVSRRKVLKGVGAGLASAVAANQVSASGDHDEFNVGIKAGSSQGVADAKRAADGVKREIDLGRHGTVVSGKFSAQARQALEKNPHVEYVEPDHEAFKFGEKLTWGIDRVDADVLHSNGHTGNGATIAILDTGIDDDHPDLPTPVAGKCFASDCCGEAGGCRFGFEGYNGNDCNYAWSDDDDHGTHCSGIADALNGNSEGLAGGVSTEASLMAGKVLTGCGSGSYSGIADGIKWATDNGADVISMSLGGSSGDSTLQNACQYAWDNNVVLVAAAGNDGPCSDCVGYPAKYSTVIAVSSTDSDDTLSDFSSTGPEVELAAPGGEILSTIPPESDDGSTYENGYEIFSGTSMACPHVSGAAAQVKAETDLSDNQNIRDRLNSTAEDLGLSSNEQGNGLLDAENAVGSGGGSDSAPSVSWVNPADGDTVSGTVTIQIDASDSEDSDDSLDVTYSVDGGSERSTSYNSTSGYYEDSWDSTSVSDGDHTLEATATDSAGNSSTSSITVTTDNTESSPAVDSLSASEVETSDGDAEFDVDWQVSDSDGDLASVDLVLTDDTDGETEDSATVSVSGDSASGTTRLVAAGDDGSGNSYTVDATVTDSNGNTGSDTASVSETEDTSSAPTIDQFSLTDDSNPAWTRYYVDWAVGDSDGDLADVTSEMLDASGSVLASESSSVSGSSASGTHYLRTKGGASEIRLTVTDAAGNSTSDSKSI